MLISKLIIATNILTIFLVSLVFLSVEAENENSWYNFDWIVKIICVCTLTVTIRLDNSEMNTFFLLSLKKIIKIVNHLKEKCCRQ